MMRAREAICDTPVFHDLGSELQALVKTDLPSDGDIMMARMLCEFQCSMNARERWENGLMLGEPTDDVEGWEYLQASLECHELGNVLYDLSDDVRISRAWTGSKRRRPEPYRYTDRYLIAED